MILNKGLSAFSAAALLTAFIVSCSQSNSGSSGSSAGIPAIRPPVSKATPSGLTAANVTSLRNDIGAYALDSTELQQRFFGAGPTKIDNLLKAVDDRMAEINTISSQGDHTCLSATPTAYNLSIFGDNKAAYFQCYVIMNDNSGGILFGKKDDVWYLYQNIGAGRSFAIVTPVADSPGDYVVEAWFSVGVTNTPSWYSGSYGVVHLKANSASKNLEMAVAGTGFGYCGAQLKTDGTNLFIKGSSGAGYNGTSWSCNAVDTACKSATDLTQNGTCTSVDESSFELTALGTPNSTYGNPVSLDDSDTDAVHFGPAVSELSQISGVSAF